MRAVIVGVFQTTSDYLVKPVLAMLFNGFLQPMFTLVQNILQSTFDMLSPVVRLIEELIAPFLDCFKNIRLFEIKKQTRKIYGPEKMFAKDPENAI